MPAPLYDNSTIAVALELRSDGVPWALLEYAVGPGIETACRGALRFGMHRVDRRTKPHNTAHRTDEADA